MKRQKDIDAIINSFIEDERSSESNPFLSTRVMAVLNRDHKVRRSWMPAWQTVAMTLSLAVAVVLGIEAGCLYKPAITYEEHAAVLLLNDDQMEHFTFYRQTSNE
jgi:hypothetical protein